MKFTIEMEVTLVVNNDAAVRLAGGAMTMGYWVGERSAQTDAIADALCDVEAALMELALPAQAVAHVPGIEVDSTSVCVTASDE